MKCIRCEKEFDQDHLVKVFIYSKSDSNKIKLEDTYMCFNCWEKYLNDDSGSYTNRF